MTRKSVQGGYCQYPDTVGCALTAAECDDRDGTCTDAEHCLGGGHSCALAVCWSYRHRLCAVFTWGVELKLFTSAGVVWY